MNNHGGEPVYSPRDSRTGPLYQVAAPCSPVGPYYAAAGHPPSGGQPSIIASPYMVVQQGPHCPPVLYQPAYPQGVDPAYDPAAFQSPAYHPQQHRGRDFPADALFGYDQDDGLHDHDDNDDDGEDDPSHDVAELEDGPQGQGKAKSRSCVACATLVDTVGRFIGLRERESKKAVLIRNLKRLLSPEQEAKNWTRLGFTGTVLLLLFQPVDQRNQSLDRVCAGLRELGSYLMISNLVGISFAPDSSEGSRMVALLEELVQVTAKVGVQSLGAEKLVDTSPTTSLPVLPPDGGLRTRGVGAPPRPYLSTPPPPSGNSFSPSQPYEAEPVLSKADEAAVVIAALKDPHSALGIAPRAEQDVSVSMATLMSTMVKLTMWLSSTVMLLGLVLLYHIKQLLWQQIIQRRDHSSKRFVAVDYASILMNIGWAAYLIVLGVNMVVWAIPMSIVALNVVWWLRMILIAIWLSVYLSLATRMQRMFYETSPLLLLHYPYLGTFDLGGYLLYVIFVDKAKLRARAVKQVHELLGHDLAQAEDTAFFVLQNCPEIIEEWCANYGAEMQEFTGDGECQPCAALLATKDRIPGTKDDEEQQGGSQGFSNGGGSPSGLLATQLALSNAGTSVASANKQGNSSGAGYSQGGGPQEATVMQRVLTETPTTAGGAGVTPDSTPGGAAEQQPGSGAGAAVGQNTINVPPPAAAVVETDIYAPMLQPTQSQTRGMSASVVIRSPRNTDCSSRLSQRSSLLQVPQGYGMYPAVGGPPGAAGRTGGKGGGFSLSAFLQQYRPSMMQRVARQRHQDATPRLQSHAESELSQRGSTVEQGDGQAANNINIARGSDRESASQNTSGNMVPRADGTRSVASRNSARQQAGAGEATETRGNAMQSAAPEESQRLLDDADEK
ncbi:unnamed protein product [Amoebophrya sp. A25]|nr:unnamed protein product [Amoebophrya sp. A25]|eukprot:GSA25T00010712001.1